MTANFDEIETGPAGRGIPRGALRSVQPAGDDGLAIAFEDDEVVLNSDWLRDNCRCAECRIRQTDERRWQPWVESGPARATRVELVDGDLVVHWSSGHISTFSRRDWDDIDAAMRRGRATMRLWRNGYQIERFDHDASVADSATRRSLFEAFRRDGAIVVTGSPRVPGAVLDFMRAIGITPRDLAFGLIYDVTVDPAGYNVAYTAEVVPPHNDNAEYAHPPSGQVLAMLVNEAAGGDSAVVDGFAVLEQLRASHPEAIDVLSRVKVGFRQYMSSVEAFTRAPIVVVDPAGGFQELRFSNQLMQPLSFDDPDLAEWYRVYRLLGAALSDPSNQVSFRLGGGESLFVNGYRVLHVWTAFVADAPRHLQDVYFDVDDVLGILARISGEAKDAMVRS